MDKEIILLPMSDVMYHDFFREYENDEDLYLDKGQFKEYRYEPDKVDAYIQKQVRLKRLPFAIMYGEEMVGELKLYDIVDGVSAVLGITMKSKKYKDRGFGTEAERLAVKYAFEVLDVPVLYADSIVTNTRSQHVLEKVGFRKISEDSERKYYKIERV
ncbi:MAG: GNAT family N-acetyltransferase [Lachnospiraceae bacterium]|nr:GNAT family N-acetyltransferase [Lachnospiraceae bacterium]